MPFTQFTSLDFDQIKAQIKDYLRANSNFTDFDFEGSIFSGLIDTLAIILTLMHLMQTYLQTNHF